MLLTGTAERERETETETDRHTEAERQRQTETEKQRQTDRQTEGGIQTRSISACLEQITALTLNSFKIILDKHCEQKTYSTR